MNWEASTIPPKRLVSGSSLPQPMPDQITDPSILKMLSIADLKMMAKKRGVVGISKMKKDDLIEVLSKL